MRDSGDQIGFGDHENRHLDAEQMDDVKMFFGLGHDAVVGGHGEKDEIDAVGAGEHVFDEALVARHIDDARRSAVRQIEVGKSQIDRDAAFLLFLEPVGVLCRSAL